MGRDTPEVGGPVIGARDPRGRGRAGRAELMGARYPRGRGTPEVKVPQRSRGSEELKIGIF